jgi:hypothetical protein
VDENCPHCGMEQVILLAKAGDRADYGVQAADNSV